MKSTTSLSTETQLKEFVFDTVHRQGTDEQKETVHKVLASAVAIMCPRQSDSAIISSQENNDLQDIAFAVFGILAAILQNKSTSMADNNKDDADIITINHELVSSDDTVDFYCGNYSATDYNKSNSNADEKQVIDDSSRVHAQHLHALRTMSTKSCLKIFLQAFRSVEKDRSVVYSNNPPTPTVSSTPPRSRPRHACTTSPALAAATAATPTAQRNSNDDDSAYFHDDAVNINMNRIENTKSTGSSSSSDNSDTISTNNDDMNQNTATKSMGSGSGNSDTKTTHNCKSTDDSMNLSDDTNPRSAPDVSYVCHKNNNTNDSLANDEVVAANTTVDVSKVTTDPCKDSSSRSENSISPISAPESDCCDSIADDAELVLQGLELCDDNDSS